MSKLPSASLVCLLVRMVGGALTFLVRGRKEKCLKMVENDE